MKRLPALFFTLSLILSPFAAFAQEIPGTSTTTPAADTSGLETCFDYYRFGSVAVSATSETIRVAQGAQLPLQVAATNENAYPVDDATVYGKIFYKKNFNKNSYGPDVIDWFVVADHVNLKAGETKSFSYTWNVPSKLLPGDYQVATYVASHDRFNLAGLTFTNDVVGNLFNFSVIGTNTGYVRFNNTLTTINGKDFHAAAFPPRTDVSKDSVPITAVVENTTADQYHGSITWKLYSWDAANEENLISSTATDVTVAPHASTTVTYSVTDTSHTVYYLMAEVDAGKGGAKSLLTTRYVLSKDGGADLPRIAFMGVTAYPAVQGQTKAFVCFHSTGAKPTTNVTVKLSVRPLDPLSWLMHLGSFGSQTFSGSIPTRISAISIPLSAASGNFAVTASIYQNGKRIDQVTTTYGCQDFGGRCPLVSWWMVGVVAFLIVLSGGVVAALWLRRKKAAVLFTSPSAY